MRSAMAGSNVPKLIESLTNPLIYPHPVDQLEWVETHISWVLLTGPYAYKIKKPVNFGFVDFSTLEKRFFYCQEELRINRRLSPALYLELIVIGGSEDAPELNRKSPPIEYAVKMVQFDRAQELDKIIKRGKSLDPYLEGLASDLAKFHREAAIAGRESAFGTPDTLEIPMKDNFLQIREFAKDQKEIDQIERVESWTNASLKRHRKFFEGRKREGHIRECHGDLHLANMVLIEGRVAIFDALEFNETLRFIDSISDISFFLMDLNAMSHPEDANRFLNDYLSKTGDYDGLAGLRIYLVYRAMVRAKVTSIRMNQPNLPREEAESLLQSHRTYIDLAERYIVPVKNGIVMLCGFSGSGKSVLAKRISDVEGMIWIRSDIERRRVAAGTADSESGTQSESMNYSSAVTRQTYDKMTDISDCLLKEGFFVILDATFLLEKQRSDVIETARKNGVPLMILHCSVTEEELRKRINQRKIEGMDPSEADLEVLAWQKGIFEPFSRNELPYVMEIDTALPLNIPGIMAEIKRVIRIFYLEQERRWEKHSG
jgi:aminoglycoside phosphotransferase family enzyme/predicted kinase